jgi:feruloyl esterase
LDKTTDISTIGLEYENLAYGVNNGMVGTGANNGHNGTAGNAFLNNPDIIIDFAWRSYVTRSRILLKTYIDHL